MSSSTYTVNGKWIKGNFNDETGRDYSHRRTVSLYEYGFPKPLDTYYEYKGIKGTKHDAGIHIDTMKAIVEDRIDPIETSSTLTSGELMLYEAYTNYLNTVTYTNNALKAQLEDVYSLSAIKYEMTEEDKDKTIDKEYELYKLPRLDYKTWKLKSANGTLPQLAYTPPTYKEETNWIQGIKDNALYGTSVIGALASTPKGWAGMQYGWNLSNQSGLTRIAAMGLAGMPDELVKSMAISTQIQGNTERIMGKQDELTAMVQNLSTRAGTKVGLLTGEKTEQHWKSLYMELNEQAQRKGLIKGNWTLRLSKNMPVKEKYKRLYLTLKSEIDKR